MKPPGLNPLLAQRGFRARSRLPALLLWIIALAFPTGPLLSTLVAAEPAPAVAAEAPASTSAAPAVPVPDDPLGRGTPRSSVERFFGAAREGDFALAARYLDLSHLDAEARESQGPRLARQLWFVLERQAKVDFNALSIEPLGNLNDGLPPNRERLVRIEWPGGLVNVDLERVGDLKGLRVWKFSSHSVKQIPKLYQKFRMRLADRFVSESTVDWLLRSHFLDLSGVTWITLAVLFCIWAILGAAFLILARWFVARMKPGVAARLLTAIYVPVIFLFVTGLVRSMIPLHVISVEVSSLFRAKTVLVVAAVWILFLFADFAGEWAQARLVEQNGTAGFHLIHLLRRIAKVALVMIGLTLWLDNMGFQVSTLLASLGIIGIAVGLASKNFIEDLIAAMTLHAAGVVKRNEPIQFGDQNGVVEDIGLRITTIRGRDRALITMPNATFATMQIQNLGRRDKFLFQPRLGLRYETTADQLRYVLIELRKLLYAHPKVINQDARVRFIGFGASSLDVDVFCFVAETVLAEFLAVTEDLNLRIMDIVAKAGTSFAFPSQTLYYEQDQRPDDSLSRQAESEVSKWRQQGQLFQYKFPEAEIAKLDGTLNYPDSGAAEGPPQRK